MHAGDHRPAHSMYRQPFMKGLEVVAALKVIVNTTALNTLTSEDKVAIRSLLDIINLCLFTPTYQVNA